MYRYSASNVINDAFYCCCFSIQFNSDATLFQITFLGSCCCEQCALADDVMMRWDDCVIIVVATDAATDAGSNW